MKTEIERSNAHIHSLTKFMHIEFQFRIIIHDGTQTMNSMNRYPTLNKQKWMVCCVVRVDTYYVFMRVPKSTPNAVWLSTTEGDESGEVEAA